MSDIRRQHAPLVEEFRHRAASRPRVEVVEWFQQLPKFSREMVRFSEEDDAVDGLRDEGVPPAALEGPASRLSLLADAYADEPEVAARLQSYVADLRRAPEWRAERDAEWERTKPSERVLEAGAVAAGCWTDEPVATRLRRVEEALRRLGDLAEQARADGAIGEATAIGEYASSVYKLREALTAGDEGP